VDTIKAIRALSCLLLLFFLDARPALPAGEITCFGQQTASYGAGCLEYAQTVVEIVRDAATNEVLKATEIKTASDQVGVTSQMQSLGGMAALGDVTGSFVQSQTVDLKAEGNFESCAIAPATITYTGTQTFQAQAVPTVNGGEVKAFGEQAVNYALGCFTFAAKELDKNMAESAASALASGLKPTCKTEIQEECDANGVHQGKLLNMFEMSSHADLKPSGTGVTGSFFQTHTLQVCTTPAGLEPSVNGTSCVTMTQTKNLSTSN
jgi:hypothetical protein